MWPFNTLRRRVATLESQVAHLFQWSWKVATDLQQAVSDLTAAKARLTKVETESRSLLTRIDALEQAAANQTLPQDLKDAIAGVTTQAGVLDDLVPDAPTPSPS